MAAAKMLCSPGLIFVTICDAVMLSCAAVRQGFAPSAAAKYRDYSAENALSAERDHKGGQ